MKTGWNGRLLPLLFLTACLIALVVLAFAVGKYRIAPVDLYRLIWAKITGTPHDLPPAIETVVFAVRAPRVIGAMIVGAALAAAGAAYQGLFRNPLVAPDILGVSSGAALGAAVGIFLSFDVVAIQGFAFLCGLGAVATVYAVGSTVRGQDPILTLVLSGVVLGSLLGSCIALLKYLADPYDQLPAITFWLLGSLASTTGQDIASTLPAVLAGMVPLYLLRWRMDVMSLGDEEARALGVEAGRLRIVIVAAATLMTAAVVSISGIIGWVGLLIPHFARMLVGPGFARLLPASIILGGAYLLLVDPLARTVAATEIPLGVLTAFIGTPVFIWLLATARRGWQ